MQSDLIKQLENFYTNIAPEEIRLSEESVQYLEYLTAVRYLEKTVPKKGTVLDSCAGTGIYSFYLAEKGRTVTAGDIVPANVAHIEQKQSKAPILHNIYEADAASLPQFEDGSFDTVLCMGALYHMPKASLRKAVVRESLRLVKPGGIFICTYMNRFAAVMNAMTPTLDNLDELMRFARDGKEDVFYAATAGEMESLMAEFGVRVKAHLALDGMALLMMNTTKYIKPEAFAKWKEYHFATCEEPSLLGSSYHNMIICQKPL